MRPRADLLIRKARVLDPSGERDEIADLLVRDGRLAGIGASLDAPGAELHNAEGLWLLPGLVDTCVHLPEPGHHRSGSIASETRAASRGGVTHLCAMPDTDPVVDTAAVARLIRERAMQAGFARVLPLGALTPGLEGELLGEMQTLREAGCIGTGNAGKPVSNTLVLKRCLEYAATFDLPVMFRPRDGALSADGCAHEGAVATRLGLAPIPAVAETLDLGRILQLVQDTGVRVHFHQLSSAASLRLLYQAKADGLPVTADVSVHHLLLNEDAVEQFNSLCHIDPPLRAESDRRALVEAVGDGTIDAVCSQHTPLGESAKLAPFPASRPGISGIETLLPLMLKLVNEQQLPLMRALDALTRAPARCLGIDAGHLESGRKASLCLLDPNTNGRPDEEWISAGRNSPWLEEQLPGRVRMTLCEGKVTWLSD